MTDTPGSPTGSMQVDTALVRELAALLDSTRLTEIEVQDGDRRIRVVRKTTIVAAAAPAYAPPAAASTTVAETLIEVGANDFRTHPGLVRAPIVGTAYLTPDPTSPPYVAVGATVKAGETLLIIEAMKVMNPITAPKAGRVVAVLIVNEQPVEYDQALIVIE
ncbi:MAG: acetyl-CoA carboxylase biotin carboxyl carrier protein [Janthinobacterium lividum]